MIRRPIPPGVLREMGRANSADAYLVFLKISHPNLLGELCIVSDNANYTLLGQDYIGFEFGIALLSEADQLPSTQLSIQNVDRRLGDALISLIMPPRINIAVIALSQFDTSVEPRVSLNPGSEEYVYEAKHLYLNDTHFDELTVTGKIVSWDYSQEPYPGITATKDKFPGLYR